jgi:hypothetical protein
MPPPKSRRGELGDWSLALSPLVHVAVGSDTDLLRMPWVYANTPLGSMRFNYPALATVVGADCTLALAAWLFVTSRSLRWISHRTKMTTKETSK